MNMKLSGTLAFLLLPFLLLAQDGYEIKVTLKPFKNQYVYLGHYAGKQMPIVDSVLLNENSEGVLKGNKKLGGGIYLLGFPDRARYFELLLDKNQRFSIIADTSTYTQQVKFIGSPENEEFTKYQQYMIRTGKEMESLSRQRTANKQDSAAITEKMKLLNAEVNKYRGDLMKKDGLLSALLYAMKEPEVPPHAMKTAADSNFAFRYYKSHYWDGVHFWDDRLVRTPFFENRLDRYFEQLVYPHADSVIRELDWMLGYATASDEMQKFLLLKFVNRYLNQKYMWEDKIFVHLFEKYFATKSYAWLTEQGRKVITDRAYSLMSNIFGSPAPDIDLPNPDNKKTTLYGTTAPYTLVVIWDPTCGHCKEVLPKLDTLYRTKWKAMGVKMFAMAKETEGKRSDWLTFMAKYSLADWVHVYYSKQAEQERVNAGIPGYSQLFDVQSFPTLYLLDKDKRIIAKKVTEKQVEEILDFRKKQGK